jgi:hypothetical protein
MKRLLLLAVPLILPAFFGLSPASAAPDIDWAPTKVTEAVAQGEGEIRTVSFTSKRDLRNISVFITPSLRSYVRATPASFDSIDRGETRTITLIFSAPLDAPTGTHGGTLHLRQDGERQSRTYSRPLPIGVSVEEAEPFEEHGWWHWRPSARSPFSWTARSFNG